MKKQNLKNFKLIKSVISNLETVNGGAADTTSAPPPVDREVSAGNWRCKSVAIKCRHNHA
ncbi:MAG: hypothetical protein AB8B65_15990 [Kordia sp.]|uniref:hypothetical protein n=1 Tax=Kordia sp. TaxID=1965332 RepID=UPI003858D990